MIRGWRAALAAGLMAAALPADAFWWGQTYRSFWLTHDLSIDGNSDDWKLDDGRLGDAYGMSFAFANDEDDLYVLAIPHTDYTKNELAGVYGQDFTVWLDPAGGTRKVIGVRLHPPEGSRTERLVELVVDTAAAAGYGLDLMSDAQVAMGPISDRGVFEARIPRSYFENGGAPRKRVTIALEASVPAVKPKSIRRAPSAWAASQQSQDNSDIPPPLTDPSAAASNPNASVTSVIEKTLEKKAGEGAKQPAEPEEFSPLGFWVRVTLADPPPRAER